MARPAGHKTSALRRSQAGADAGLDQHEFGGQAHGQLVGVQPRVVGNGRDSAGLDSVRPAAGQRQRRPESNQELVAFGIGHVLEHPPERGPVRARHEVAAIAAALGFDDASYFCRYFKKYARQTPLAFRQAMTSA